MWSKRKQPLYDQLVDLLKEQIETEMEPNSMLPSERELSEKYGLSRTTVRLAFQELEKIGYIYRQHGKGTFVSNLRNQTANLYDAYSYTEHMKAIGKKPKTETLGFEIIEANKFFAEKMGLKLGSKIIKIKRLRMADGQPMMLERSYLPHHKFLTLSKQDLKKLPLYEIFSEKYNEIVKIADVEFYASITSETDAKALNVQAGAPSLQLLRTTYNVDNEIIEFTISVARADQFRYKVRHNRLPGGGD